MRRIFVSLMLCGVACGIYASDGVASSTKNSDELDAETREFRTGLNSICKGLANSQCPPVNENHYPEVACVVDELARLMHIGAPQTFVIDADSQAGWFLKNLGLDISNNAVVIHKGSTVAIVFIDQWLVDNLTSNEIAGVIAHELAHVIFKKSKGAAAGEAVVESSLLLACWVSYVRLSWELEKLERGSGNARAIIGWLASAVGTFGVATFFPSWLARRQEMAADLQAVSLTKNKGLVSALEKMRQHDSELYPVSTRRMERLEKWFPWGLGHPTLEQRKKYIEQAAV